MMRRTLALGTLALALILSATTQSQGPRARRRVLVQGREAVDGEVIVKYRNWASATRRLQLEQQVDPEETAPVGALHRRVRSRRFDVDTLLNFLRADPSVEYAEPNYILYANATPNDLYFNLGYLWGLLNNGQSVLGRVGVAGADVHATAAWDVTTGSRSIVIGVVDTGIDYTHADLAANVWTAPAPFSVNIGGLVINCAAGTHGFNAILRTCDPRDDNSPIYHGTHVSGTIGGVGNNGLGVTGVNWITSIMGAKFLNSSGSGFTSDAINAIEFTIQTKTAFPPGQAPNVRVLSNSWGGGAFSQALLDEINRANANDILFVAAAGNSTSNNALFPSYPASYNAPNIIAVAASDNTDHLASFSNYGSNVHLAAPGVSILSTAPGNSYQFLDGTSMATPFVSGAAALVLSNCNVNTATLKSKLLTTVDVVGALTGWVSTNGRLNVDRAVRSCVPQPPLISGIFDQVMPEESTKSIVFSVADFDTPVSSLTVTGTSSNQTLLPNSNISFTGTTDIRFANVTPVPFRTGTTTITLTVSDGALTASTSFLLTVTPINHPPTVTPIADQLTYVNTATPALAFTISDPDGDPLTVTTMSNNTSVVPNANIAVGGSGANRTITVTPAANATGLASVTFVVSDGPHNVTSFFDVLVTPTDVLIADTFGGTDGTPLTSHTPQLDLPSAPWTVTGSSPMPVTYFGSAQLRSAGTGHLQATLDSTISDFVMAAQYRAGVSSAQLAGMAFRLTDANNHLVLMAYSNQLQLYRKQGGVFTLIGSAPIPAITQGSGHQIEVRAIGSTLEGWWDGVRIVQATETFNQNATRHGLLWNSAYDSSALYEAFTLRAIAPQYQAPLNASTTVPTTPALTWTGSGASSFDVYLGTTNPPPIASALQTASSYVPGALAGNTTYFWQVVAHYGASGLGIAGPVWSFTTAAPPAPPAAPGTPTPGDNVSDVSTTTSLSWVSASDLTTYAVSFGTINPPPQIASGLTSPAYAPGVLARSTQYYWRISATNSAGTTAGPVWTFTTSATASDVLVSDAFNALNGTPVAGRMPDVTVTGGTWVTTGATPSPVITGGMIGLPGSGTGHLQTTVDTGASDVRMTASYRVGTGAGLAGFAFRLTDANNHLMLLAFGDTLQFFRKQGGAYTAISSGPISTPAPGTIHQLQLIANGPALEGWWDNVRVVTATDSFQQTATRHGFDWNSAYDQTAAFDSILIRALAVPVPPDTPASPTPIDGATSVATSTNLTWTGANAASYDIKFGTTNPPPIAASGLTTASYSPTLAATTTYYWQVVARSAGGTATGPTWSFTTGTPPPMPADILIQDTFTGGGLLTLHSPDFTRVAASWTATGAMPVPALTGGVVGVGSGTGHLQATVDIGQADVIVSADMKIGAGPQLGGFAFRLTDANNHLLLLLNGPMLQFFRKQGGSYTPLLSGPIPPPAPGSTHRLQMKTNGPTLQAWWDNVLIVTTTDTFQQTATRHGFDWNSAYDPTIAFDNFEIKSANGPVVPPDTPSSPAPIDGAINVAASTSLTWTAANAATYDVNFGTTNPPPLAASGRTTATYAPVLAGTTTYYWQVVAHSAGGTTTGPIWTLTTATPPPVPADVLVQDTFTGSGPVTGHNPDFMRLPTSWAVTGGTPTPALAGGVIGVTSGTGHLQATVDSGQADVIVSADIKIGAGPQLGGFAFRLADGNNHLLLLLNGPMLQFFRKQSGAYTALVSGPIPPPAPGSTHRLQLKANGPALQALWDSALIVTTTDSFQQTATRHGLDWNSAYDPTIAFDNLEIKSANGPVVAPDVPGAPTPADGATTVATSANLTWTSANAASYDVNFGTVNPPPLATSGRTTASFTPTLAGTTTYYWQVVAHSAGGTTTGPVWSFTTDAAPAVPAEILAQDTFSGSGLITAHTADFTRVATSWTVTGGTPTPTLTGGVVGISAGSGHLQATLNPGQADVIVSADIKIGAGPQLGGFAFRLVDANNHLVLLMVGQSLQFFRKQNGAYVALPAGMIPPAAPGSTHRLQLRAIGPTLEAWWDHALVVTVTDSFQQAATRHGLDWNSAYDETIAFDNFEIKTGAGTLDAPDD